MKIAFLGDSLTAGWPGSSYFALLRTGLADHDLLNHGRAGDTIADLEARMCHSDMSVVDLAFVWIGVNDAFGDENYLVGRRPVFEHLLAFVGERACVCVCVPPLLPDNGVTTGELSYPGFDWRALELRVQTIAALIAEIVADHPGVRLLDLHEAFAAARAADQTIAFTIDGVHLSDHGARIVADAFTEACRLVHLELLESGPR